MKQVLTGVPQGSIIGLLLFNIFINDIVNACDKFVSILYADDTTLNSTLYCFGKNTDEIENSITNVLQKVFKWFDANKLCLNVSKSKVILFHMPKKNIPQLSFNINGLNMEYVTEYNFLGHIFDSNLNWKAHTNFIGVKIAR